MVAASLTVPKSEAVTSVIMGFLDGIAPFVDTPGIGSTMTALWYYWGETLG